MNETLEEKPTNTAEAKTETLELSPEENRAKIAGNQIPEDTGIQIDEAAEIDYLTSEEYIKNLKNTYEEAVLEAAARLIRGEISAEEQARLTFSACIELSAGIQQHVELVEQLEREEAALVEFDSNLAEQIRIMRKLDREAKARKAELRRQQRVAKQQAELERLTTSYNATVAEINGMENRGSGPKL